MYCDSGKAREDLQNVGRDVSDMAFFIFFLLFLSLFLQILLFCFTLADQQVPANEGVRARMHQAVDLVMDQAAVEAEGRAQSLHGMADKVDTVNDEFAETNQNRIALVTDTNRQSNFEKCLPFELGSQTLRNVYPLNSAIKL